MLVFRDVPDNQPTQPTQTTLSNQFLSQCLPKCCIDYGNVLESVDLLVQGPVLSKI